MTRALRHAHRAIFVALAILLPILLAIAVAGRKVPATSVVPPPPSMVP